MMRIVKRFPVFVLVLAIILASVIPSVAETAERTTQEKAVVLSNLKIISGVNGEFYLDNPLRRNEAVTFIVRLIGMGDHVNQNKSQYSDTPYSDVPSTEWYAPFIGYCYQNGFITESSTAFRPLDYITEKEFLSLVLMALEYEEGEDFTLDTAFDKAREIGLLTLSEYINRASANQAATRGSAVELMYKALTTECRDNDRILLQKMIEAGVVTRLEAMAMGLIVDSVFTDIVSVEGLDLNRIQVTMNEAVSSVGSVLIYSSDDEDSLSCSVDTIEDDIIVVVTEPLEAGKEYVLELLDVKDRQGNITNRLTRAFTGFETYEITSDFFRISRIEPVNQRSLMVYFTHPLSINSEICLYYTLTKDYQVIADGRQGRIRAGVLNSDNRGVLLSLDSDLLKDGEVYTLTIDGDMVSAYGVRLNDGEGDSMKFIAKADTDARFELVELVAVDKNTLLLNFSKEVNPFLARQIYNFYLTDAKDKPVPISSTTVDANGRAVYLVLGEDLSRNGTYNLTINNLNDITKQEYITEQVYSFKADYGSTTKFRLNRVTVLDNQTIELTFNKPLDSATATNPGNYTITRSGGSSGIRPAKVLFESGDRNKVILYLDSGSKLLKQNEYILRIDAGDVKDYLGNGIENTREMFSGTGREREPVRIEKAVAISTDAVKLELSQGVSFTAENLVPSNYILEYSYNFINVRKVPVSVIYGDAKTLVLKFDKLEYDTPYTLKVSELTDITGNVVKGLEASFSLEAR